MLNRLAGVFKSFQEHEVRYVIIGGVAVILHGVPRATFDLDILIDATLDNADRLLKALSDAGFGTASLTSAREVFTNEITIFKDRIRIDVQTSTPGLDFHDAWARRETMTYRGQQLEVLSKEDLIASKRAAGRKVDMEDVLLLNPRSDKAKT